MFMQVFICTFLRLSRRYLYSSSGRAATYSFQFAQSFILIFGCDYFTGRSQHGPVLAAWQDVFKTKDPAFGCERSKFLNLYAATTGAEDDLLAAAVDRTFETASRWFASDGDGQLAAHAPA